MGTKLRHKLALGSFLVVVLVAGLFSWTLASTNGPMITACVKNDGILYVVGEGFKRADCKNNDQLLSWNIGGPRGPQGVPGVAGPQGLQGVQGPAGTTTGSLINKSRVYQRVAVREHDSRGNYVTEAFCDGTNDVLLTSWYDALSGDYSMRVASSQHIFNPSARDSWRLTYSLEIDPYFAESGTPAVPAQMNVWITCLRAD